MTFGFGQYHVYAFYPGPTLTCCNIYGNENIDWDDRIADQLGVNGNIFDDPGFCGTATGDFTVCALSPCLQLYPGDCDDIIGAFGEGCESCEQTPVYLTDFIATLVENEAHFSWIVEEDTEDARYRLVRVNEIREREIPYTEQGNGYFQAVDYLNNPGMDQGNLVQGPHAFQWNGRDSRGRSVASGAYSIQLVTEGKVETQGVLLLR